MLCDQTGRPVRAAGTHSGTGGGTAPDRKPTWTDNPPVAGKGTAWSKCAASPHRAMRGENIDGGRHHQMDVHRAKGTETPWAGRKGKLCGPCGPGALLALLALPVDPLRATEGGVGGGMTTRVVTVLPIQLRQAVQSYSGKTSWHILPSVFLVLYRKLFGFPTKPLD